MNSEEFLDKSRDMLVEFYNTVIDADYTINSDNINIVSFYSCGGEFKVIFSTFDDLLYEISYSDIREVFVFDVYRLCSHQVYSEEI